MERRYFAITGNPVSHSKSPELFNSAYPGRDDLIFFRLAACSGEEAFDLFNDLEVEGMNITSPFKGEIVSFADSCSDEVKILNAANSLIRRNDHSYEFNSDPAGVIGALVSKGVTIAGERALILGAGGAGCAAAYALKKEGAEVTIVNRTLHKAKKIAKKICCAYVLLDDKLSEYIANSTIIVNALLPGVDPIDKKWIREDHTILDALYHDSILKSKAMEQGAKYIGGEEWLIHQGVAAYRIFTGIEPDYNSMKKAFSDNLKLPTNISLIGFMGAGKTSVANHMSEIFGISVKDTDVELEKRYGKSIRELIQERGEVWFRDKEAALLKELLTKCDNTVIACGGGIITRPDSRKLLNRHSIVVYLHVSPEESLNRIEIDSRPLLAREPDPLKAAQKLFAIRKADYLRSARFVVNTVGRDVVEVTNVVYEEINNIIEN